MSLKSKYKGGEIDVTLRLNEWIKAVRSPPPYRVAGRSVNLNTLRLAKFGIVMLLVLTVITLLIPAAHYGPELNRRVVLHAKYNDTYPLTRPKLTKDWIVYKIGCVADLDTNSKHPTKKDTWISYFKTGYLKISHNLLKISIDWDPEVTVLQSHLSEKGRAMELSELVVFNGKLYTCDDRSGIIFEINTIDKSIYPWVILLDGNGHVQKGFKCEWMTVKDHAIWAGGLGKEWTTITGVVQNFNPQWVKSIGHTGDIIHHEWINYYNALREKGGYQRPGYIIHESGVWSSIHKQWFFLPRRASTQTYEEQADEQRATNILFRANEDFSKISMCHVGPFNPTHGFSSFKFIPGTKDQLIVALKSEEDKGHIATYITVFTLDGEVLFEETKIGDNKFEGIEFI